MPSERESPPGEETKSKKDVVDLLKNLEKRFEGKLSSLKQNDISFEYNLVKGRGEKHSCGLQTSVGSAPKNADKNRYTDVIPFDMNCVELSGGQYVNASCVRVNAAGDGQRVFYAAQGPLKETTGDFWGMLYENKIPAIVMLTRFFEKTVSKCEPYFPEQEGTSQQHGDFEVEAVGKHAPLPYCKEVTVRTLRVTPLKGGDPLTVKHFFYGGWPDHGKPKSSTPIRQIIHELRMSGLNRKPVAVHCSAGIGRTGTFCTIDVIVGRLRSLVESGGVHTAEELMHAASVSDVVAELRSQRRGMVQTLDQFHFCHIAVRDELLEMIASAG